MNRLEYAKGWNHKTLRMGQPMTAADAAQRYTTGPDTDWFSVGAFGDDVPDGGVPDYVLEIVPGPSFISVSVFDQFYCLRYKHEFRRHENRLFLEEIVRWDYPNDGNTYSMSKAVLVESVTFRPDGTGASKTTDYRTNMVDAFKIKDMDMTAHWEPIPVFGEWDSIARFER